MGVLQALVGRNQIENSLRQNVRYCAIACGIRNALGSNDDSVVRVSPVEITVRNKVYKPTGALAKWIRDYDDCKPVHPIRVFLNAHGIAFLETIGITRIRKNRDNTIHEISG